MIAKAIMGPGESDSFHRARESCKNAFIMRNRRFAIVGNSYTF